MKSHAVWLLTPSVISPPPGGNGLLDPCEKGKVDAAGSLTAQDRANITLSAQVCLHGNHWISMSC